MTLIEVLLAIALFAVVAVPLLGVYWQGVRTVRRSSMYSLTTYEAQMRMEEAYGLTGAELLAAYNTTFTSADIHTAGNDPIELSYEYKAVKYETGAVSFDDVSNLYKVTVTVSNDFYVVGTELEAIFSAQ